ncbi:branched-subunit amino acid transport protein [Azospirillum fermentarium]|uniref:AzlD domain-containing protein n=1 Tax=Azospirillum fermentarium TaxID=1233114 RepID=UPI002225F84D|nr:AzlD domain-containing protein [Azospirillum fermentarium]MCW2247512.1 branched-subunit amino acid transport protein [Azospirillum fermentarium]
MAGNPVMGTGDVWLPLLVAAAVTYAARGLGVALGGRLDPNGAVFRWVGCVAYALLAGLVARMIVFPVGPLAAAGLGVRLAATAMALGVFWITGRSVLWGAVAGVAGLILLLWLAPSIV